MKVGIYTRTYRSLNSKSLSLLNRLLLDSFLRLSVMSYSSQHWHMLACLPSSPNTCTTFSWRTTRTSSKVSNQQPFIPLNHVFQRGVLKSISWSLFKLHTLPCFEIVILYSMTASRHCVWAKLMCSTAVARSEYLTWSALSYVQKQITIGGRGASCCRHNVDSTLAPYHSVAVKTNFSRS